MTNSPGGDILFGSPAGALLAALSQNNTREWFTAHRPEYDELVAEPLQHLLATAARYGPGRVMRAQRDVRFSKDKTPYKTTASLWAGTTTGVYLQLDATGLTAGGGLYDPTSHQLARARTTIADDPTAANHLTTIVHRLEKAGFELAGPSLTTAPRGYPRDHPDVALLRLRHYAATRRLPLDATTGQIHDTWKAVTPLNEWVEQHVVSQVAEPRHDRDTEVRPAREFCIAVTTRSSPRVREAAREVDSSRTAHSVASNAGSESAARSLGSISPRWDPGPR